MEETKRQKDQELLDFKENVDEEFFKENKVQSTYYTKEQLLFRMDTLRKNYSYIEKIFNYNDSTLIFSVFRPDYPEYHTEFRDVYFVNIHTGAIEQSYPEWRTGSSRENQITKMEDFYTVDLINSYLYEPIFYQNKVYKQSPYPAHLFKEGTKKEIDKIIFSWQQKNPSHWFLFQYDLAD